MERKKETRKHVNAIRVFVGGLWTFILLIPMLIMDLFIEIYHRIAFPLCSIPLVKRKDYIKKFYCYFMSFS